MSTRAQNVFRDREGWHAVVDGQIFGTWPDKGSALAGYETERRRADTRLMQKARDVIGGALAKVRP